MSADHYENFPVASLVLPAPLRPAVLAIYRYARTADDIADEGDAAPEQRLAQLDALRDQLNLIYGGRRPQQPLFVKLAAAIATHRLPPKPFYDLLEAFSQDVRRPTYADFPALLAYCRRSANPIGRLLLYVFGAANAQNITRSDAICTALQLTNFWQDVALDWQKGRVYLPQDEMAHFGVTREHIAQGRPNSRWGALMHFQIERTRRLMEDGAPLGRALPGRIGLELRLTVAGGLRILEKIERVGGDVFNFRPTLGKADWALLLWRALRA